MKLVNKVPPGKSHGHGHGHSHSHGRVRRRPRRSLVINRNNDAHVLARSNALGNRQSETDENEPSNIIKLYHGREWSEVEHLLQPPPDSERGDDDEDEIESLPQSSTAQEDADALSERKIEGHLRILVDALDNLIRLNPDHGMDSIFDYFDIDLRKKEAILRHVHNWMVDMERYTDP